MKTFLDPRGHAYVNLQLPGIKKVVSLNFLIDTGFSGGISIPRNLKYKFNFQLISRANWELADGSEIELGVYLGRVKNQKGEDEEMPTIFSESKEGLAGIEFLQGRRFVLDLKKRTVKLSF